MKAKTPLKKSALAALGIFLLFFIIMVIYKETSTGDVTWPSDPEVQEAAAIVKAYAKENGYSYSDYPDSLIALLARNPETQEFVLNYPEGHDKAYEIDLDEYKTDEVPLFMQWDARWGYMAYGDDLVAMNGCGPVCLAMAGFYWTGDEAFSPDKMVTYAIEEGYCVQGNGTSWTLFSEGAVRLGLDVTEIPLDKSRIEKNLEVGNPIVCVMGPGDFTTSGHYIVMTGLENGLIRVNDPNSYANSEKLWNYDDICDQIRNLWVIRK